MITWTYRHVWPILDRKRFRSVLVEEAVDDLRQQVANAGVRLLAAPQWRTIKATDGRVFLACWAPAEPAGVLTPEQRRPIVARLARAPYGWTDGRIAAALGVLPGAVLRDRVALGIPSPVGRGRLRLHPIAAVQAERRLEPVQRRALVAELVEQGCNDVQISRELGVSRQTACLDRHVLGLASPFPAGGRPRHTPVTPLPERKAA